VRQPRRKTAEPILPDSRPARIVAGCMTGTSIDGLDIAVLRIRHFGLRLHATLEATSTVPLGKLAAPLRRLAEQQPMTAGEIAQVQREFSLLHLAALKPLHEKHKLQLVSVHGQTVFHAPPDSWQLFQPAPLAHGLGVPVVCDMRAADLANGGQGAPLTPLADFLLLRHGTEDRAVVNLGGFCNLTRLPGGHDIDRIAGLDVCACNQVLDAVARAVLDAAYDRDGQAAMQGTTDERAATRLATLLRRQAKSGRSLGTGDEAVAWVEAHRGLGPADLAATACAAVASTIVQAATGAQRLILAGGGTRNRRLVAELAARAACPVQLSDDLGVPTAYREAMGWAVLGALCQDRQAIALPQVTGAERSAVAGLWCLP
jgi:anhydro-N-acetylmuramic acid kinase